MSTSHPAQLSFPYTPLQIRDNKIFLQRKLLAPLFQRGGPENPPRLECFTLILELSRTRRFQPKLIGNDQL